MHKVSNHPNNNKTDINTQHNKCANTRLQHNPRRSLRHRQHDSHERMCQWKTSYNVWRIVCRSHGIAYDSIDNGHVAGKCHFRNDKISLQGLPVNLTHTAATTDGIVINNTYTGALGLLQNGDFDTLIAFFAMTPQRMQYFTFPMPIAVERVVVLVRRALPFQIRLANLNANIHMSVYASMVSVVGIITIVYLIHKRLHSNSATFNHVRQIVALSLPGGPCDRLPTGNMTMTMKVIEMIACFTVLMFTSYYQCEQLNALLLPPTRPVMSDIRHLNEQLVNGQIITSFTRWNGSIEIDLKTGNYSLAKQLQHIWTMHPPEHESDALKNADAAANKSRMIIGLQSNVIRALSRIDPKTCDEYELITLREMAPLNIGLAFRRRYPFTEDLNRVITERLSWSQRIIGETQLSPICREKLSSVQKEQTEKIPLSIETVSGVLVAYICGICVTIFAFCSEIFVSRRRVGRGKITLMSHWNRNKTDIKIASSELEIRRDKRHIHLDAYIDDADEIVSFQYKLLLRVIQIEKSDSFLF